MHDEYLKLLKTQIANDGRILAAWLEGSLGRGNADRYSDIDLHLLLADGSLDSFRAAAEQWLAAIRPLVLFNTMFEGKMINGLRRCLTINVGHPIHCAWSVSTGGA